MFSSSSSSSLIFPLLFLFISIPKNTSFSLHKYFNNSSSSSSSPSPSSSLSVNLLSLSPHSKFCLIKSLSTLFLSLDSNKSGKISKQNLKDFLKDLNLHKESENSFLSLFDNDNNNNDNKDNNNNEMKETSSKFLSLEEFINSFENNLKIYEKSLNVPLQNNVNTFHRPCVFLGGSCGKTSWRDRVAVPLLSCNNISYYNPQVKVSCWNENLMCLENFMKSWCEILLFVIGKSTRSIVSSVEAGYCIGDGRNVILVLKDLQKNSQVEGEILTENEIKDINRAREYLKEIAINHNTQIFNNVEDAIKFIIHTKIKQIQQ